MKEWDETDKIELKLFSAFSGTCSVCGGYTGKAQVSAYAETTMGTIIACEDCLKHGEDVDSRLRNHIKRLEGLALDVRSLIGRLRMPSYVQWLIEKDRVEDEIKADDRSVEPEWLDPKQGGR